MPANECMRDRDAVHRAIEEIHQQLQLAHAGIAVASGALRYQNSEQDLEIANVLDFFVSPRVDAQIERAAQLMRLVARRDAVRELTAEYRVAVRVRATGRARPTGELPAD